MNERTWCDYDSGCITIVAFKYLIHFFFAWRSDSSRYRDESEDETQSDAFIVYDSNIAGLRFYSVHKFYQNVLFIISLELLLFSSGLCSSVLSAAVTPSCSAVYRGFADCLVTLGDSVSSMNDNPQDINSICK